MRKVDAEALLAGSPFKGESDELNSVAISPSNKYFAVGGALGVVRLYEFSSGKFLVECKAHSLSLIHI